MPQATHLTCDCGRFHLDLAGAPFIATKCHCNSCRAAAERLSALPPAFPLADTDGGTPFVLYRKDRVTFPQGTETLTAYRLSDKAPTRRVLTSCCNTPLFLEFEGAHWFSLYAGLWPPEARPASQIRTMTSDLPIDARPDDSLPAGKRATAGFYARLLGAWIAMGFKAPRLAIGNTIILEQSP